MATNQALIHYALDQQEPPVMACDTPAKGALFSTEPREVTCPHCVYSHYFPLSQALDEEDRPLIPPPFGTHTVTGYQVLMRAADLLSDSGDNPEYDRAIVELTSALIGAGQDDRILMSRILRSLAEGN
jgi:hypothetical protein